ncbi:hypothetical protein D5S17_22635 [Pseudonocardiaceae bacterium YIM PH 21723]|nr:hypothetical protein D5S17_22635 [Pseudonocardiaceae bacterium YIM PH 21723]
MRGCRPGWVLAGGFVFGLASVLLANMPASWCGWCGRGMQLLAGLVVVISPLDPGRLRAVRRRIRARARFYRTMKARLHRQQRLVDLEARVQRRILLWRRGAGTLVTWRDWPLPGQDWISVQTLRRLHAQVRKGIPTASHTCSAAHGDVLCGEQFEYLRARLRDALRDSLPPADRRLFEEPGKLTAFDGRVRLLYVVVLLSLFFGCLYLIAWFTPAWGPLLGTAVAALVTAGFIAVMDRPRVLGMVSRPMAAMLGLLSGIVGHQLLTLACTLFVSGLTLELLA